MAQGYSTLSVRLMSQAYDAFNEGREAEGIVGRLKGHLVSRVLLTASAVSSTADIVKTVATAALTFIQTSLQLFRQMDEET